MTVPAHLDVVGGIFYWFPSSCLGTLFPSSSAWRELRSKIISARSQAERGVIVNTSSGAGVKGFPGQAAYAAAKHGVIGLTRSAALDYAGENIRVNAVCPGIIETPMMGRFTGGTAQGREAVIAQEPVGRMGKPEEIAATVLWMCSDLAGFVVGASIVVDGGQTV